MDTAGHRLATPASAAARFDGGELAAIFCGGFLGALARAGVEQALAVRAGQWPWATFAVNILAALLLGWFVTHLGERSPGVRRHRRTFLTVGVCGALSTFSTMMLELLRMLDGSHWSLAFGYVAASLAGGLLAVRVSGRLAARRRVRG